MINVGQELLARGTEGDRGRTRERGRPRETETEVDRGRPRETDGLTFFQEYAITLSFDSHFNMHIGYKTKKEKGPTSLVTSREELIHTGKALIGNYSVRPG
jgi:hypothetical protein